MSNLERESVEQTSLSTEITSLKLIPPRKISLHTRSGTVVNRNLPHRELRSIGPWCFLDQFGPAQARDAMKVAAHPHAGLQTVTWLISGSVLHQDSLGTNSVIKPGELNLMTSGRGVAHSELSIDTKSPIHGIQLWVALPDEFRNTNASFEHHRTIPKVSIDETISMKVFAGHYLDSKSPATFFGDLVGAEIEMQPSEALLTLDKEWEYGLLAVTGKLEVDGVAIQTGQLLYSPPGAETITLRSSEVTKVILIGGPPLRERIVMWWNFLARNHEEIAKMREAWEARDIRFPSFESEIPGRIPAPPLPNIRLMPR